MLSFDGSHELITLLDGALHFRCINRVQVIAVKVPNIGEYALKKLTITAAILQIAVN